MNSKFFLMRHAEGKHNLLKKKLQFANPHYKQTIQFKNMRLSEQFIDPKDIYIPQNLQLSGILQNFQQIDIIVTSPLRRCLQTTKFLKNKLLEKGRTVQIIVQPYLASRLCYAWNLGTTLPQLLTQYSDDHFNFCNFPQNQHWGLNFMQLRNTEKQQKIKKNNLIQIQDLHDLKVIFEHIIRGNKQTFDNLKIRMQILKERLKFYSQLTPKKLLIVSHSCLMNTLCSKQFDQKGKPTKKMKFPHLEMIPMDYNFQIQSHLQQSLENYHRQSKIPKAKM